jgi:hypothetical protein
MTADARTALLLAAVALGAAGCDGATDARALDRICGASLSDGNACEILGVGAFGTGVTGDSTGVTLDDATLVIHLAAIPELRAPGSSNVALLAIARQPETPLDVALTWGSCAKGCPPSPPLLVTPIPTEYTWVTVASNLGGAEPGAAIPYDALLTFTGVNVGVADLRITSTP